MPRGRKKGAKYTSATRRLAAAALLMGGVSERETVRQTGAARETVRQINRDRLAAPDALVGPLPREAQRLQTREGRGVEHRRLLVALAKRAAIELVRLDSPAEVLAKLADVAERAHHLRAIQELVEQAEREEERWSSMSVTSLA